MLRILMSLSENMNGSFSPEMLSGLSGQNGMDFSNIANIFGQFNKGGKDSPLSSFDVADTSESSDTNGSTYDNTGDSFDAAIQNILSEYDMAQAENYTKDLSNNDSNQEVFP